MRSDVTDGATGAMVTTSGEGLPAERGTESADDLAVVVVEVDGLRCGLPAADVTELHAVVGATPMPGAPDVVEGVINVRGSVVAMLDLRARFGLPRRPPLLSDHLVMARVGRRLVALRVDRALDLLTVPRSAIDHAVASAAPHVGGVARLADGLVLIHDLATFLSREEAEVLDAALAEAGAEERA
jgi:purine-binding chemotaxis protein CheW